MSQDNNTLFEVAVGIPWISGPVTAAPKKVGLRRKAARRRAVVLPKVRQLVRKVVRYGILAGILGGIVISTEAIFRARLVPVDEIAPTRYYARPVMLRPGDPIDVGRVESGLQRMGYERTRSRTVGLGQYSLDSRRLVIGRRAFRVFDRVDPGGVTVAGLSRGRISTLRDAEGSRIPSALLEPELFDTDFGPRMRDLLPVPLTAVPQHVVDAVLTVEDQRFFQHWGVDAKRVGGAAAANVQAGRIVQGASTITQQLSKNLFLSPERSWIRKFRELAMAVALEIRYDKERILEAYLNEIYLGQDGSIAIHGIGRAAQFYFGKDVSQLDVGEAALMAGIIRGPSAYSPFRKPERALERRNITLRGMASLGHISETERDSISNTSIELQTSRARNRAGRYFSSYASNNLDESVVGGGGSGVSVFTTVDIGLQQNAEAAVRDGIARMEARSPDLTEQETPLQVALVAIDPVTGEILAMVGGRDFGQSQFNRATNAHRQPGSAFKPIVALAALSERIPGGGSPYTLASRLEDTPFVLTTPVGDWRPNNYDGQFRGSITLREAMVRSLNVPFARLGVEVGPEQIARTAAELGIESWLNPVPSLALGSSEVTLLELTRAFGVLAAGGVRATVRHSSGVLDNRGQMIAQDSPESTPVYNPAEAYLVTSALQSAVERGTGQALRSAGYHGPVAGKSGTTNDYRDAWFIGYTPELVVGVWVGFDDGTSVGLPGSAAALPIVAQFLRETLGAEGGEDFAVPRGLEVARVSTIGPGGVARCNGDTEIFLAGTVPQNECNWSRSRSGRNRRFTRWPTRRIASDSRRPSNGWNRTGL